MADENETVWQNNGEGIDLRTLEERVARLEAAVTTLAHRIGADSDSDTRSGRAVPAVRYTTPSSAEQASQPGQRLISEKWRASSYDAEKAAAHASASSATTPMGSLYAPTAAAKGPSESLESRLGSQIFNRIAIVLLLIGTAYSFKLAVDRQWIVPSPTGRVIFGLLVGAGLVLWSESFRRKRFAAFSYSLKAVGSGVLYLTLWAAFQRFHLLPASVAMALMILVTTWNAYMAWAQNSELLAYYALTGGFASPMLLSTGGNHEIFLFTYLLAIDVATIALVRLKGWSRLLIGAFPLTVGFYVDWASEFYAASELVVTLIFIALFGAAFASVAACHRQYALNAKEVDETDVWVHHSTPLGTLLEEILLPLGNAAFVAMALYSALDGAELHSLTPWAMVLLAALYLGLMRAPQSRTAEAIHLSLAVVLLTIAVPIKASGHWITLSWLTEGLALLWGAARIELGNEDDSAIRSSEQSYASSVLRWLAMAALVLGYCGMVIHAAGLLDVRDLTLFNRGTGTALAGVAIFAAVAALALRTAAVSRTEKADEHTLGWGRISIIAFILINVTALLLTLREWIFSWEWSAKHTPLQTADFGTALIGLAIFAGVVSVSLRLVRAQPDVPFWIGSAGLSTIAFNLIAVLTGVREISAIWGSAAVATPDAALQQALAVSAYLMLYSAALLAVGFWRRNGFLRWQALALLVFTICKTFFYDMRNLSQGYRVGSLLGLGVLLMAISFAYQEDWLGLRATDKNGQNSEQNAADSDDVAEANQ